MDDQLKTFIAVADNHSFNKAANQLFISAPAVIKQINTLENNIKVTLFIRTHNGVSLTKAGESFYQDAVKLVDAYNHSVNKAQNLSQSKQIIKIGAGPLATGTKTNNIWIEIGKEKPNFSFQFIPCSCSLGDFNEFLAGIGKDFDLVSSVYDKNLLKRFHLKALKLDTTPLKLSVPISNPLAQKETLSLNDLNNQVVALPIEGKFNCFDEVRKFLKQNPTIRIKDISGFDMNVLNECASHNWLLCSAEDWQTAHPLLKAKAVNWKYSAPFGIIYNEKSNQEVNELIDFLTTKKASSLI